MTPEQQKDPLGWLLKQISAVNGCIYNGQQPPHPIPSLETLERQWREYIAHEELTVKNDPLMSIARRMNSSSANYNLQALIIEHLRGNAPKCNIQKALKTINTIDITSYKTAKLLFYHAKSCTGLQCNGQIEVCVTIPESISIPPHWTIRCPTNCQNRSVSDVTGNAIPDGLETYCCRIFLPYQDLPRLKEIGNSVMLKDGKSTHPVEYVDVVIFAPLIENTIMALGKYPDIAPAFSRSRIMIDLYGYSAIYKKPMLASDITISYFIEHASRTKLNALHLIASTAKKPNTRLLKDIERRSQFVSVDRIIWQMLSNTPRNPFQD